MQQGVLAAPGPPLPRRQHGAIVSGHMISRRALLAGSVTLLAAPLAAAVAQPTGRIWRIGVLNTGSREASLDDAFARGLRESGYVEGQNVAIEWRWANFDLKKLPELAMDLVQAKVDVIVAQNNPAIEAAQRATRTIPIVMVLATDPVASGFVVSLARPGGNITGFSGQSPELSGKRLQLLKEATPQLSRVAVVWDPAFPGGRAQIRELEAAAESLRVQLQILEARTPGELERAFKPTASNRPDGVLVIGSTMLFGQRGQIRTLASN